MGRKESNQRKKKWPTNSFLVHFPDCAFENDRIDHFTDQLNDLLYNKYWLNMWLSQKKLNVCVKVIDCV